MKILFIIIGLLILAVVIFAIYRYVVVKSQNKSLNKERFDRIKPLYEKLESGQEITRADVLPYASNILTREHTFQLLNEHNQSDLFPKEFNSIEKGAESNLANWLEFPTELDACPDELELVKRVTIIMDANNIYYYVFKFRVNEPHWAAKDGWMLGVVGPYFDDSQPYDFPGATFSRFDSKFDTTSPEEEAKWVHENIAMSRNLSGRTMKTPFWIEKAWGDSVENATFSDIQIAIQETLKMDDEHGAFWVGHLDHEQTLEIHKDLEIIYVMNEHPDGEIKATLDNWEEAGRFYQLFFENKLEEIEVRIRNKNEGIHDIHNV